MKKVELVNVKEEQKAPVVDPKAENYQEQLKEKETYDKDHTLISVTPLALTIKEKEQSSFSKIKIASMAFLCVTDNNNFITINRSFILESEEEEEALGLFDMNIKSMGLNIQHCIQNIAYRCPCYATQLEFEPDESNEFMWLKCTNSEKAFTTKFKVGLDSFMAMTYIEDAIYTCDVDNNMFLYLSTIIGCKEDFSTRFIKVDSVNMLLAVTSGVRAPIEKLRAVIELFKDEPITELAIVVGILEKTKDSTVSNMYSVMMPFNSEKEYKKSKFKGMTIEQMEQKFYNNNDQFSSTIAIDGLKIGDEEYLAVRAKNAKHHTRIFLFSKDLQKDIADKIEKF